MKKVTCLNQYPLTLTKDMHRGGGASPEILPRDVPSSSLCPCHIPSYPSQSSSIGQNFHHLSTHSLHPTGQSKLLSNHPLRRSLNHFPTVDASKTTNTKVPLTSLLLLKSLSYRLPHIDYHDPSDHLDIPSAPPQRPCAANAALSSHDRKAELQDARCALQTDLADRLCM